jgi:FtsH-binding integral membrane protein
MIYFGILVGLVIMAVMVYMALNKRTDFPIRVASLIALAVMIVAIIVCLFLIFTNTKAPVDPSRVIVGSVDEIAMKGSNNTMMLLLLTVFLVALLILVSVLALKDHKRKHNLKN